MTYSHLHALWAFFLGIVPWTVSYAQDSVTVKASVDRTDILIGEPINLRLEATLPSAADAHWFAIDSLPHFEWVEKGKLDSAESNGFKSFSQDFTITSFDSGVQVLPSLRLLVDDKAFLTDSIRIAVRFAPLNPNQDYHDIKDIFEVVNPFVKYIAWVLCVLTLASIGLSAYLVNKRQRTVAEQPPAEPLLSPFEQAMQALQALKQQRIADPSMVKNYYTRLNDILRLYVFRRFQMASLEKTNDELIVQMRDLNLSRELFHQLAETLRMSDFVKFAKYVPQTSANEANFSIVESSIQQLNQTQG